MTKKKIGAGIIAIDKDSGKLLLARRGMECDDPNTWVPFGGTFDKEDGNPKVTAKREFWEEAGVNVPYKISKKPFYVDSNKFIDFYSYLGLFNEQFKVTINEESLGYGWFDIDNLPDNLHPGFERLIEEKYNELKRIINNLINNNYNN
jgi:8-oxo-dGTP pyrophosphatase MutT (NUDIX family)